MRALPALGVAVRVADENQSVPGDRSGGDELARAPICNGRLPDSLAGVEVIGQYAPILGSAKQHAVEAGRPSRGRNIEAGRSSRLRKFSAQVAGLIENISVRVVPIRASLTTIRPDTKVVYCFVSYVQRILSLMTVLTLISANGA
jgi:hypothetical protein